MGGKPSKRKTTNSNNDNTSDKVYNLYNEAKKNLMMVIHYIL